MIEASKTRGNAKSSLDKDDPVNTAHGNYHFQKSVLDLGGIIPVRLSLLYDSTFIPYYGDTVFKSHYWCINHHLFLSQSNNEVIFEDGSDGGTVAST